MTFFPEPAVSNILVNSRPIRSASPTKLWRRNSQAAVLDFDVPVRSLLSLKEEGLEFRQGDLLEFWYGLGASMQRLFYGYLPNTLGDRDLSESNTIIKMSALDFLGQLQDRFVTLGDSASSFLNLGGYEVGAAVAQLAQDAIDSQYTSISFSVQGVQGTNPQQFLSEITADRKTQFRMPTGKDTSKKFIDQATTLSFDDSNYPSPPLLYTFVQRDQYLIWRKQSDPSTSVPCMRLTVGKDAILSGKVQRQPVYSDALIQTKTSEQWAHADTDTSRRWGGRRFFASATTQSSFLDDAQSDAVRNVEIFKSEQLTFNLILARDGYLLYPGDIVALDNAEAIGLKSQNFRIEEVTSEFMPVLRTTVTIGTRARLLTDYLA